MGALREVFLFPVSAEETIPGRVGRIDTMEIRTSIRSVVLDERSGLVPRGIEKSSGSAAEFCIQGLDHRFDAQVFQGDMVIPVNIVSAPRVQKIIAAVLDLLMDPGNLEPLLPAVPAAENLL